MPGKSWGQSRYHCDGYEHKATPIMIAIGKLFDPLDETWCDEDWRRGERR